MGQVEQYPTDGDVGMRTRQCPHRLGPLGPLGGVRQQPDGVGFEPGFPVTWLRLLGHHQRAAGGDIVLGVRDLVIVGGLRIGNDERGDARAGQFGEGGGPAAGDRKRSPPEMRIDGIEERGHLGLQPRAGIRLPDFVGQLRTGLVDPVELAEAGVGMRQQANHCEVQGPRPLAAPQHQHGLPRRFELGGPKTETWGTLPLGMGHPWCGLLGCGDRGGQTGDARPYGVAGVEDPEPGWPLSWSGRKADADRCREPTGDAVGASGHGVLLEEHGGDAASPGG